MLSCSKKIPAPGCPCNQRKRAIWQTPSDDLCCWWIEIWSNHSDRKMLGTQEDSPHCQSGYSSSICLSVHGSLSEDGWIDFIDFASAEHTNDANLPRSAFNRLSSLFHRYADRQRWRTYCHWAYSTREYTINLSTSLLSTTQSNRRDFWLYQGESLPKPSLWFAWWCWKSAVLLSQYPTRR